LKEKRAKRDQKGRQGRALPVLELEEENTDSKYSSAGLVAFVTFPLLSKRVMQCFVFQGLLQLVHGSSVLKEATR
jgi:hypothetical protein